MPPLPNATARLPPLPAWRPNDPTLGPRLLAQQPRWSRAGSSVQLLQYWLFRTRSALARPSSPSFRRARSLRAALLPCLRFHAPETLRGQVFRPSIRRLMLPAGPSRGPFPRRYRHNGSPRHRWDLSQLGRSCRRLLRPLRRARQVSRLLLLSRAKCPRRRPIPYRRLSRSPCRCRRR